MDIICIQHYKSPIGILVLGSYKDKLCLCDWENGRQSDAIKQRLLHFLKATFVNESSQIIQEAKSQLLEYFDGKRICFDIPLLLPGTEFQNKVWNKLQEIPYGETWMYSEVAEKINNKNAVRAVSGAIGKNAISIIIPCHRVIGANGELIGYGGGLEVKKHLLDMEGNLNK